MATAVKTKTPVRPSASTRKPQPVVANSRPATITSGEERESKSFVAFLAFLLLLGVSLIGGLVYMVMTA